jgi:hypothetical protein
MKFAALSFVIGISGVAAAPAPAASAFEASATAKINVEGRTAGQKVRVEGVEGRTAKIFNVDGEGQHFEGDVPYPTSYSMLNTKNAIMDDAIMDECKEGMVLVHVPAHPFAGKFCVKEDDHCRTLPEDDEKFCRRAGEGSRLSIATSKTKCDASNCGNWDCDAWCKCFNDVDETDGVYADYECEDDDGTDECKCLVDYGKEPFPRTCEKNFFKPTPGRPAHDGTGCRRCTDLKYSCNTNENTIIPCTTTTDAVCKPKKICYEVEHHEWRMKDSFNKCATGDDHRHWTFIGHLFVDGAQAERATGCNHVPATWQSEAWHSVADSQLATGEYQENMQMTLGYESWENDIGDTCAYNGDHSLTTTQYKQVRTMRNVRYLTWSGWKTASVWLGGYHAEPYQHTMLVDGDDCRHVESTTRQVLPSPNHGASWRETVWKDRYTEMKVRTRTYRANSCDGCAEDFFRTDVTDPDADAAGCKACSDMSFCNTHTHTIIPCTATTDAVCKPKKLCYEIQHYQWRMKDSFNQCEAFSGHREWTFYGRFTVENKEYKTQCKEGDAHWGSHEYRDSSEGSPRAVGEFTNGMKMTLGYESWEHDKGDRCNYDPHWELFSPFPDECHQNRNKVYTVPRSDDEWRITEWTEGYTSMKVQSKTYYKEGSC